VSTDAGLLGLAGGETSYCVARAVVIDDRLIDRARDLPGLKYRRGGYLPVGERWSRVVARTSALIMALAAGKRWWTGWTHQTSRPEGA
jgi:hypothetical protein